MCGIAGEVNFRQPGDERSVTRMLDRIAHRGPDSFGLWSDPGVILGHRRLSVIDPAARSLQPMLSPEGKYAIVFNGEIYNFRELRSELEGKQERFLTTGDTEVLLRLLAREGLKAIERLNGMFALAIWDRERRELWAARDRFGEKPFYYHAFPNRDGLLFASEMQALAVHDRAPRQIDSNSFSTYLANNYVVGEQSILKGVKRLPPGHWLTFSEHGGLKVERYWDLAASFRMPKAQGREEALQEELRTLVDDAVRLRLVADVPLGAFLSGGVDSSIVVSSMARAAGTELRAYSVGFEDKSYDELPKARAVARHLGVELQAREVRMDLASDLEVIAAHGDEPFADTSIVPTYYLSKFAREHVTVALSGDGGDELFGGYDTYVASRLRRALGAAGPVIGPILGWLGRRLPTTYGKVSFDYKLRQFGRGLMMSPPAAHWFWRNIHDRRGRMELLERCAALSAAAEADGLDKGLIHLDAVGGAEWIDQLSYFDIKTWLVDDVLHKVDRASMAHSLEVRAPFLDHRVAEFAARLPGRFKQRGWQKKRLLRRAFASRFEQGTLDQAKAGFGSPVGQWMAGPLRQMAGDHFASPAFADMINRQAVTRLFDEHMSGKLDHGYRLFNLLMLALWQKRFPVRLSV